MISFEQAFSDTEKAASSTIKSATDLANLAKQLQKAAKEGNIAAIKRTASRLDDALGSLRQEVGNAVDTWPFKDEEETAYLREHYTNELCSVAAEKGLDIHERDGTLISHPSIVRILPDSRAVRIDKKQVTNLRPSRLTQILLDNQKKGAKFRPEPFLESLYNIYRLIIGGPRSEHLFRDNLGTVVPLQQVYSAFTSLPGSRREYDRTEFARDLFQLEVNGPRQTKNGLWVSFPASTGARSAQQTFAFVGPDWHLRTYFGIQFAAGE